MYIFRNPKLGFFTYYLHKYQGAATRAFCEINWYSVVVGLRVWSAQQCRRQPDKETDKALHIYVRINQVTCFSSSPPTLFMVCDLSLFCLSSSLAIPSANTGKLSLVGNWDKDVIHKLGRDIQ